MLSTQAYQVANNRQRFLPYTYSTTIEDELRDPPSLSSSPISQYSGIYHSGPESQPPFSANAAASPFTVPRSTTGLEVRVEERDSNPGEDTQLMNDGWSQAAGPFRPKISARGGHNRDSSLSTLESTSIGPTSPYSHHGALTPRIAIAESGHEVLPSLADYGAEGMWPDNYAIDSKASNMSHGHEAFFPGFMEGHGANAINYTPPTSQRPKPAERHVGLAPPAEFPTASRHGADSVASSTIGGDSPATPALGEQVEERRRTDGAFRDVPKFERSITDACQDSIYSNNMTVSSSSPSQQQFSPSAPFTIAVELANKRAASGQHLSIDSSPNHAMRGSSPFRNGSPLAPVSGRDFQSMAQYQPSQRQPDVVGTRRHGESSTGARPAGTPQTISPKDAMLELDDIEDNGYAMFPSQQQTAYSNQQHMIRDAPPVGAQFSYVAANAGTEVRVPQQYPFIPSPMHVDSSQQLASSSDVSDRQGSGPQRGDRRAADDGGTYSCTYHGCKRRFDSQKELQTHKREGHRAAGVSRRADRGQSLDTQHGPHICMRLNPSTNKPCGSKFSRPYDLTRHEDTIHNANKRKLRCRVCPEEKLFSRRDALNRHFKVCHEDLYETEFPRRRRNRLG